MCSPSTAEHDNGLKRRSYENQFGSTVRLCISHFMMVSRISCVNSASDHERKVSLQRYLKAGKMGF